MLIFSFLILLRAKKEICLCNSECSIYCPDNQFIFDFSRSSYISLKDFLDSMIEGDQKLTALLYSPTENFAFDFDSNDFPNLDITFQTLLDSKEITINLKKDDQIKSVTISPKQEVTFSYLF